MFKRLRKRCRRGFTLAELAIVAGLVSAAPAATYLQAKKRANQTKCLQQMRQIGQALQMHVMDEGSYPKAAFYPKAANASDSIRQILKDQGVGDARLWCCPGLPPALAKKGLTFLYNDKIGGKRNVGAGTWVLIEFSCVSGKSPLPHPGGYNILYGDGSVKASKKLPADLAANLKKAAARKKTTRPRRR
jgi:prepilin-type processing-associated H-X9-DG protein